MTPWIVLAVYVIGWFVTARLGWVYICDRQPLQDDDWWGLPMFATFWPIIVLICLGRGLLWLVTHDLPKPRLPRKLRDGDPQRIAELEYELGITDQAPPGHFQGPHVGRIRTERIGDQVYEIHEHRGQPNRYIKLGEDG